MRLELEEICARRCELLVVGGGIYGLSVAWVAAAAGVQTVLVERAEYGSGVSANSLRIVHGGLRYLQTANLRRFRKSVEARRQWLTLAPEFVRPLQCLAPIAATGLRSRWPLAAALQLNDLLSADRNRGVLEARRLTRSRILRSDQVRPAVEVPEKVAALGYASWWDARLNAAGPFAAALARAAGRAGALMQDHTEAVSVTRVGGNGLRVRLRDCLEDGEHELDAALVLDVSGRGGGSLRRSAGLPEQYVAWVGAANLYFDRPSRGEAAVAFRPPVGPLTRKRQDEPPRDFFFVPEAEGITVGTTYVASEDLAEEAELPRELETRGMEQFTAAAPWLGLVDDRPPSLSWGWLPARPAGPPDSVAARLLDGPVFIDGADFGTPAFLSLTGVKFTTALREAVTILPLIGRRLGRGLPPATLRPLTVASKETKDFSTGEGGRGRASGTK